MTRLGFGNSGDNVPLVLTPNLRASQGSDARIRSATELHALPYPSRPVQRARTAGVRHFQLEHDRPRGRDGLGWHARRTRRALPNILVPALLVHSQPRPVPARRRRPHTGLLRGSSQAQRHRPGRCRARPLPHLSSHLLAQLPFPPARTGGRTQTRGWQRADFARCCGCGREALSA